MRDLIKDKDIKKQKMSVMDLFLMVNEKMSQMETIEEVNTAIKQLNTNKAHDYFGLTAENFIHASNQLIEHFKQLINLCFVEFSVNPFCSGFCESNIFDFSLSFIIFSIIFEYVGVMVIPL
jgi:hypothetical protein